MLRRGLTEKLYDAINPLPGLSEAELFERAGLHLVTPRQAPAFLLEWHYGGGHEKEYVAIAPGDFVTLRESDAKLIEAELGEQGLLVVPHGKAPADAECRAAITRAASYWHERGAPALAAYRRDRGISPEDLEEMRDMLWPYYAAKAKAEVLREALAPASARKAKAG